ncbi:MAG: DUF6364 family protein [Prevotella sp.]
MNTIAISSEAYNNALLYAKSQNITVDEIVENYLKTLVIIKPTKRELPDSFRRLKGILADVNAPNDERLNYILSNY